MQAEAAPSPNFGARRGSVRPDLIVLHYTAMATAEAALARLRDPAAEVSAHYLIAEDGRTWTLVEERSRAWHAGEGAWGDVGDVNSRSIGVELANCAGQADHPPFPEPQMAALEALLDPVMARWSIPPSRVIGHSDMAPGRKTDPGRKFDWRRLALGGRTVWPPSGLRACVPDWPSFRHAACCAGYVASGGDWAAVLAAFRLRFRPEALGRPLEGRDVEIATWLAAEHPCVDAGVLPA